MRMHPGGQKAVPVMEIVLLGRRMTRNARKKADGGDRGRSHAADIRQRAREIPMTPGTPGVEYLRPCSNSSARFRDSARARARCEWRERAFATCCKGNAAQHPVAASYPTETRSKVGVLGLADIMVVAAVHVSGQLIDNSLAVVALKYPASEAK